MSFEFACMRFCNEALSLANLSGGVFECKEAHCEGLIESWSPEKYLKAQLHG